MPLISFRDKRATARRLRILHVVPTYFPATRYGGPIYTVHGLCAGLARRGHDVQVFTTNVDGRSLSEVPVQHPVDIDGVSITYFATALGRRFYRSPSMKAALDKSLASFSIVHLHSVFLWPTLVAAAMARRDGVPYVLAPRGMLVPELIQQKNFLIKKSWIRLFERRNVAAAAAVHVTSDLEAADILRLGLSAKRFVTIPNGVDLPADAKSPRDGPMAPIPRPIVLFLGRLNWKKGLDSLIPAMSLVPHARLVIAGNDEDEYTHVLLDLARKHRLSERVHFIGPQEGPAKWLTFASADVFVLPSYSENFGVAVLEAMASGVPVVVTPQVGLAKAVANCGAGLVVEKTPAAIGAAIADLIASPELRRRMGLAGRDAAAKLFSWDAVAEQMERLYLGVISDLPKNSDALNKTRGDK